MISRALGQGRTEYAKKVCSFCMWSCVIKVIVLAGLFLIFMDQILGLAGASVDTWEPTRQYLTIIALGGPFILNSNCYSNAIRAEGQAGKAAQYYFSPVMILGLGWGISGATIATVVGNIAGAGFYIREM